MRTRQEVSRQTAILSADTDCLDKHVEASRHVCLGRGFNSRRLHHFFKKSTAQPFRGYPLANDLRIDSHRRNISILWMMCALRFEGCIGGWLQILKRLTSVEFPQGSFNPLQVLLIAGLVFGAAMLEGFLEMESSSFKIT